jgi:trans-aconitate 2-methyltransferase
VSVWDPLQYRRFGDQRRQPFVDLLAMVERRADMRVVDLGCGTGELTRELHDHLGASTTRGVDNSPTMLAKSAAHADERVSFVAGDITDVAAAPAYDLVFSNAALHWLPDHEQLVARLADALADDGQLAIQVPANHHHPSHVIADEVAAEPEFASALDGFVRGWSVLSARAYAELLHSLGFRRQSVRLQVYGHELGSVDDVVEWVKGTLLTAYQQRLDEPTYQRYLARYRQRLRAELGEARPFFYTYDRILMWGTGRG